MRLLRQLTPARRAWLSILDRDLLAQRPRGRVGWECMVLGWTSFVFATPDGRHLTREEAAHWCRQQAPETGWNLLRPVGETLTVEGRLVLRGDRPFACTTPVENP